MIFALVFALLLYTLATGFFLASLLANRPVWAQFARASLLLGAIGQAVWSVLRYQQLGQTPFLDVHEALAAFAWLLVVGYMGLRLIQSKLDVAGLFIAPVADLLLAVSAVTAPKEPIPPKVGLTLLPFHIGASVVGTVALGLGSAAAIMYLVLERRLRQKKFGAIYQKFPSLDVLDSVAYRCSAAGFLLFTLGLITGVFTAREDLVALLISGNRWLHYTIGALGWGIFGVMLQARVLAGWTGRRAAMLTILGFLCVLTVFLLYLFR
jgi:ABC-type uncharacterized transport system permease subunit